MIFLFLWQTICPLYRAYWEMWPMPEQKDLWSGIVICIRVWNLTFERSHADFGTFPDLSISLSSTLFDDEFLTPQKLICQIFIRLRTEILEGILNRPEKKMERPTPLTNCKTVLSTIWLRLNGISPDSNSRDREELINQLVPITVRSVLPQRHDGK